MNEKEIKDLQEAIDCRLQDSLKRYNTLEILRLNLHDFMKCEIYKLSIELGYNPYPEMRVRLPNKSRTRGYQSRIFDIVLYKNGEVQLVLELQGIQDEDTLHNTLKVIDSPLIINIKSTLVTSTESIVSIKNVFNIIRQIEAKGVSNPSSVLSQVTPDVVEIDSSEDETKKGLLVEKARENEGRKAGRTFSLSTRILYDLDQEVEAGKQNEFVETAIRKALKGGK